MDKGWTLDTLKEHFDDLRRADLEAGKQMYSSQQVALEKAKESTDTAIKKAEDSIEKKSDAVYVKLTDLQKAFSEVMLRPEIEGRLIAIAKDVQVLTKISDNTIGTKQGLSQGWVILISVVGLISTLLSIVGAVAAILVFND